MTLDSGCLPAHLATTTASRDEPVPPGSAWCQTKQTQKEEFAQRVADLVKVSTKALGVPLAKVPVKLDPTRKKISTNLTRKTAGTNTTHKL